MTRDPRFLVALPLLALLTLGAGYTPSGAQPTLEPGHVPVAIGPNIPPIGVAVQRLARLTTSNGRGQFSANVGGRLMSVVQAGNTHLGKLMVMPGIGQYHLLATSPDGRTSVALILVGHGEKWHLGAAMVRSGDGTYTTTRGSVTVHQLGRTRIQGTFSLVAMRQGHIGDTIEVRDGQFSVHLRQ